MSLAGFGHKFGSRHAEKPLYRTQRLIKLIFVSASHQTVIDSRSMTRWSIIVRVNGGSPAALCWSLTHLVQCGPDEPGLIWTQIRVQLRMPDYSSNWTTGSVLYKFDKCVNDAARPPKGGPLKSLCTKRRLIVLPR